MAELREAEILALAKAAGVTIPPGLVAEVAYSINGTLETLDAIDLPGLDAVEPIPIIIPSTPLTRS